jgi:hypothetical protein
MLIMTIRLLTKVIISNLEVRIRKCLIYKF